MCVLLEDEVMMLPPPAVPLEDTEDGIESQSAHLVGGCGLGLGPLPPDIWRRVGRCLDARSLCCADVAAKGCRHEPEAEEDIWAHLCAEHFPTMYRSVLADIKRSCV